MDFEASCNDTGVRRTEIPIRFLYIALSLSEQISANRLPRSSRSARWGHPFRDPCRTVTGMSFLSNSSCFSLPSLVKTYAD